MDYWDLYSRSRNLYRNYITKGHNDYGNSNFNSYSPYINSTVCKLHRKNLKEVNDFAEKIAMGDLSETLKLESNDEFYEMGKHLNSMASNLQVIIEIIKENSESISASSEELSATIQELAANTLIINEAMENTAQGIEGLVQLVKK